VERSGNGRSPVGQHRRAAPRGRSRNKIKAAAAMVLTGLLAAAMILGASALSSSGPGKPTRLAGNGSHPALSVAPAQEATRARPAGPSGSRARGRPAPSAGSAATRPWATGSHSPRPWPSGAVSSPPPGGAPTWMLTKAALTQVLTEPAIAAGLDRSRVLEILRPGQQPVAVAGAQPVMTFWSVSQLDQAISGGQVPAGTRSVLYDPEAWSLTPRAEQLDPAAAAQRAAQVAHAHGLSLIVAPALDLTTVGPGPARGPLWQRFLQRGLAGAMARVADVVELQAQSLERDPGTYTSFLRAAAAQARAAHPGVTVLAGLSTNPPGAVVAAGQLTTAIQGTRGLVDGYWMNIPGQGSQCPSCHAPRPDLAQAALRSAL
jgi:hypothetical protein